MFKFLRQYQKHILAVGVTLLMVAFLIQPTISMFQPDPVQEPIGSIGDTEWTIRDKRVARGQLAVLERLSIPLTHITDREDAALQWMLIQHDAKKLGLWAGDSETNQLLLQLGKNDSQIAQIASDFGATRDFVRNTVRLWLIVQQYIELVSGLAHLPTIASQDTPSRIGHYQGAQAYQQIGHQIGMALELAAARGTPRLSPPVVQRFLHDQQTTAKITAVPIPHNRYLSKVDEPNEQELQDLFDQYRDSLPGSGDPYGFGYRKPDRVKIDYISIPFQRVLSSVQVDEADALDYYDNNPDEFRNNSPQIDDSDPSSDTADQLLPYTQVRSRIVDTLQRTKAQELSNKMIKAAQAALLDDLRTNKNSNAGIDSLISLGQVAEKLQKQYGVLPDTSRRDDIWLNRIDLSQLPGIGRSALLSPRQVLFVDYALSVKPLRTDQSPPALATLTLDLGAPSMPVQSFDGSKHLFRVTAAEPAQSPDSIDQVHEQVLKDAKTLAAYRLLKEEAHIWIARAKSEGLLNLAAQLAIEPISPEPFQKKQLFQAGDLSIPFIPGVGRDGSFCEKVFDLVDNLVAVSDLSTVSESVRMIEIPVDKKQALFLTRLDDATPMTQKMYEQQASRGEISALINQALYTSSRNPVSVTALAERVGFTFPPDSVDESESESDSDAENTDTDQDTES